MDNKYFTHLHLHDQYSVLDGLGTAEKYCERAKEIGFQSLALTNHGNVDGCIQFQKACDAAGIRPVIDHFALSLADRYRPLLGPTDDTKKMVVKIASTSECA